MLFLRTSSPVKFSHGYQSYRPGGSVYGSNPDSISESDMPTCIYVGGAAGYSSVDKDGKRGGTPCYIPPGGAEHDCPVGSYDETAIDAC